MLLQYAKEPEYFLDVEKNKVIEIYDFLNNTKAPLFKLGEEKIAFDKFILEVQRVENKIENIFLTFHDVETEKIVKLSEYYQMVEDENFDLNTLKKASILFSVDKEAIESEIQPKYDSPEKSKDLISFKDSNEDTILLNLDFYLIEGIIAA
ncbi:MAG: hypothetical protein U0457_17575 [Candidatus Sericytochromatia bacterium]